MRNRFIFFLCVALIHGYSFSQPLQTAIWYFGHNAGIQFVGGNPVALSGGQINNVEGCAVQSDHNGNLLFYTDGVTLWNKNHIPMPNGTGLFGNTSTTQTLIVQKPGDCMKYYVFYQSGQVNLQAYYSIVDMTLNGGLGDVVISSKNTFLYYPATEKMTSVLHQNGTDIWVIMHELNSNKFMAYLVTTTGINAPVNSNTGPAHNNMIGYMKASHDGTRLAAAISFGDERTEIYDFNKTSGIVSNPFVINNWAGAYGLEFSPNDSILYVTTFWLTNTLYQINLATNAIQTITTANNGNYDFGALQLGPNGKIYMARGTQNYLCAINNPNVIGIGCNYQNNAVTLAPGTTCASGLPTFNQALFDYQPGSFSDSSINCLIYGFQGSISTAYDSVCWDFGDPISGVNNISHDLSTQHSFSSAGTYNVSLIIYTYCFNDTILHQVNASGSAGTIDLGNDTIVCAGNPVVFDAGTGFDQYLWQDGSSTQTYTADSTGYYSVTVSDSNGCMANDSVHLNVLFVPADFNLGNDTAFCQGGSLILYAGAGYDSYIWQNGDTLQSFAVAQSGFFSVTATSICKTATDSIVVTVNPLPQTDLGADTVICQGSSLMLDAGSGFSSYFWQDGSTAQTYIADTSGYYTVTVIDTNACTSQDSILISAIQLPAGFNLGNDTAFCQGGSLLLNAGSGYDGYYWQNGDTIQSFTVSQSGIYSVTATSTCETTMDSINITVSPMPQVDLGPDTVFCEGTNFLLDAGGGFASYLWQDASTQQTYTATTSGTYTVTVSDTVGCQASDQIVLTIQQLPSVNLGTGGLLCNPKEVELDAEQAMSGCSYLWQDGSVHPTFLVTVEGSYSVSVTNSCGMASDTVNFAACPGCVIDVPNAFTPDGDGQNDVLYVLGGGFTTMKLLIYNRHGEKVFETQDPAIGWDGTYKGKLQENDIYYFYLQAVCVNGREISKKGDITLLN